MQILENTIMLVEVTLNCTVRATKNHTMKKMKRKKDSNNNQNINKQTPTCTCPSINKLTAGALVICKKNRYAHWDKASFYHLFDTEIIASTGSDITIQLAIFFFPNMQQYILAELHFRHIQNYDLGRIICSKEYGGWSFEQGVNSVYQNQIFQ